MEIQKLSYNTSKSKSCTLCGRTSHTVEVCYKKTQFPPHFGNFAMVNNIDSNDGDDDGMYYQTPLVGMVLLQLLKTNLKN